MKKFLKRLLSAICAVCMLTSGLGGMELAAFARREPVVLRQELKASDDRTYEITVSYDLELEEGEEPPEELKLVVHELLEPEPQPAFVPAPAAETAFEGEDEIEVGLMAAAAFEGEADTEAEAAPEGEADTEAEAVQEGEAVPEAEAVTEGEAVQEGEAVTEGEAAPAAEEESLVSFVVGPAPAPEAEAEAEAMECFELSYEEYVQQAADTLEWNRDTLKAVHVFDISLHDPVTDEEIEPEGSVRVSIRLLEDELAEDTCLSVVHFAETDEKPEVMPSFLQKDTIEFETESFSVYVVVADGDTGPNARIGYTFWYPTADGNYSEIITQYFRREDVTGAAEKRLYSPGIPDFDEGEQNTFFSGWHRGSVSASGQLNIESATVEIAALNTELVANANDSGYVWAEGTRINLYASFNAAYYITYVDVNPENILATDIVVKQSTGTTFTVKTDLKTNKYSELLLGWQELKSDGSFGALWEEGETASVSNDLTLYPRIEGGHWLIFDDNDMVWDAAAFKYVSGGASYTPPALYMNFPEQGIVDYTEMPKDPTRAGYTFEGWYTSPDCLEGEAFTFGGTLSEDTVLYAKWTPGWSSYRVVYWKQSAQDAPGLPDEEKTWEYADSRKVTINPVTNQHVLTGETVYRDDADTKVYGENGTSEENDKKYFRYNKDFSDASVLVKADGSSVLNIYYDRVVINFRFYVYDNKTYYTKDDNGTYGFVDGAYKQLKSDNVKTVYSYTIPNFVESNNQGKDRWGIVDGQYVKLTGTPVTGTSMERIELYELTDELKADEEYLIVSTNTAGTGYAITRDGTGLAELYTVHAKESGTNAVWIDHADVADTSKWTVGGSTNKWTFKQAEGKNTYFIVNYGGLKIRTGSDGNQWIWNADDHTLQSTRKAQDGKIYYIRVISNGKTQSFERNEKATSVYLYVKTTGIVTKTGAVTHYTYKDNNGQAYPADGKLYVPTNDEVAYPGVRYEKSGSVYTETDGHGTSLYGKDKNGVYCKLTETAKSTTVYYYEEGGVKHFYTGERYTQHNGNGYRWHQWNVLTGLYGATFADLDLKWPAKYNGTDYAWYEDGYGKGGNSNTSTNYTKPTTGGSRRTVMAGFLPIDNDGTDKIFYGSGAPSGSAVRFYLQELDGTSYTLRDEVATNDGGGNFNISDKYAGFHAAQYRTYSRISTFSSTYSWSDWKNVGAKNESTGIYGTSAISYGKYLEIHFDRNEYKLNFYKNNDEDEIESISVKYGADIFEYKDTIKEGQKDGYYFAGWYADRYFLEPYDFGTESKPATMPAGDLTVYGLWLPMRVRVALVPGSANVDMGSQALSFRLDYDEPISGGLIETATRPGYILDGWYTDNDFSSRYHFGAPVNSSVDGIDWTYQTAPKWQTARVSYGDDSEEYRNVQGILTLYAKWNIDYSKKGFNVQYDAGEGVLVDAMGNVTTKLPIDPQFYQDDAQFTVLSAPKGYGELYTFNYWQVIDSDGNVLLDELYPGAKRSVTDENLTSYFDELADPITGEIIRRTIMLRAKYTRSDDVARFTQITFNGNTFVENVYPSGTETLKGMYKYGTQEFTVTSDKEVNETLTLPGENDFFLSGYKLIGWSFFKGSAQSQRAQLDTWNAANPTAALINMDPGLKVAADNLSLSSVNSDSNILYAMWEPKTYTVTVEQVVKEGVSSGSFTYNYRIDEESNLTNTNRSLTLNGSSKNVFEDLSTNSATKIQYYGRTGHAIRIKTPTIPDSADYAVSVTAYVKRDDGTTVKLDPASSNANGELYRVEGDVTITYTYALKVDVTISKSDMLDKTKALKGAKFVLTPVQYNNSTRKWDAIGSKTYTYDMASVSNMTQKLQEGAYLVEETKAPSGYALLGVKLVLTVRNDANFSLRTENGAELAEDIAGLGAGTDDIEDILNVYDRPLRELTVAKEVVGGDSETDGYEFTVSLSLDGTALKSFDTAGSGNAADKTDNSGYITFKVKKDESRTLKVPYGTDVQITEKLYKSYTVETAGVFADSSDCTDGTTTDTDNRVFSLKVEKNATVTYTNTRKDEEIYFKVIDGFGAVLGGASFSVYKDYACTATNRVEITDASEAKVTSVASAAANSTAENGDPYNVFFKLEAGVYYMKQINTVSGFIENTYIYRLVVGETGASTAGVTLAAGQKFRIDRMSSSTTVDTEADIKTYGVMNISAYTREYIFSNVSDSSDPLVGARFEIYYYDRTRVSGNAIGSTGSNGGEKEFSSGTSGAFFIELLPFGVYYLKETQTGKPNDAGDNYVSKHDSTKDWFGLGVDTKPAVKSLNEPAATSGAAKVVYGNTGTGGGGTVVVGGGGTEGGGNTGTGGGNTGTGGGNAGDVEFTDGGNGNTGTVSGGNGNTGTVVTDDDDPLVDDEGMIIGDEEG